MGGLRLKRLSTMGIPKRYGIMLSYVFFYLLGTMRGIMISLYQLGFAATNQIQVAVSFRTDEAHNSQQFIPFPAC